MKKYDVYALGNALVDTEVLISDEILSSIGVTKSQMTLLNLDQRNRLVDQLTEPMMSAKKASGGSAANSIIAVNALGGSTFFSGKVADDENGHFYHQDLIDLGVDCQVIYQDADDITGSCLVLITPDAERSMNTHLGISETLDTQQINAEAIACSEWLYMEGYLASSASATEAVLAAKTIIQQNGGKTALSLSDVSMIEFCKTGLDAMLSKGIDLLFCNEEEAKAYSQQNNVSDALNSLQAIAQCIVLTRGAEGAIIFKNGQSIHIDAILTDAIDTNGAGDAFAGGFLYGLTHGLTYEQAGKLASRIASKVVSQYGPRLTKLAYIEAKNLI